MTYLARYQDNKIYDVQFDETDAVEILDLDSLKQHLQITFSDDDEYLETLITSCRQALERFCNISLVTKQIFLLADLYCERELPYGPVDELVEASLKTSSDYELQVLDDGYQIDVFGGFMLFKPMSGGRWKLVYNSSGQNVPKDLILDLKRICAYCYEHRGDEALTSLQGGFDRPSSLDQALELFASKHRRMQWL